MKQAMAVFEQTGQYPDITIPTANTVGGQALQAAITREGDPYVWGAAGPDQFDCSGLVVWAYAQEGIALPHYTGSLWNSGVHVARADLEPGDLVFFFADISHVGIYIGDGMMIDAPDFGETVRVEPIYWSAYVGAVRIGSGPAGSRVRVAGVSFVDEPQPDEGEPGLVRVKDAYLVDNKRREPAGGDDGHRVRVGRR